jgi:hypothetical protein
MPNARSSTTGPAARALSPERKAAFEADVAQARIKIDRAFALAGLAPGGSRTKLVCPGCGAVGKTKLNADGYAHCYKEQGMPGYKQRDAIEVLRLCGWTFADAVDDLLDRPRRSDKPGRTNTAPASPARPKVIVMPTVEEFTATVDTEVYNALMALASHEAAVTFYGRWHISAEAVASLGARVLLDPDAAARTLSKQFGLERLVACGLAMPVEEDKDSKNATDAHVRLLVNRSYPVIEPHMHPNGRDVLSMQFRASVKTEERIRAHKQFKAAEAAALAAGEQFTGEKAAYVHKFLSLRGSPDHARVGGGLPAIRAAATAPDRDYTQPLRVVVVEGLKDVAAAATWGRLAYALPGAGVLPPARVLAEFARLGVTLAVALDGDSAGEAGKAAVLAHLEAAGISAVDQPMPAGMDVTDTLVARFAARGCTCPTCLLWRQSHPAAA